MQRARNAVVALKCLVVLRILLARQLIRCPTHPASCSCLAHQLQEHGHPFDIDRHLGLVLGMLKEGGEEEQHDDATERVGFRNASIRLSVSGDVSSNDTPVDNDSDPLPGEEPPEVEEDEEDHE
uniref:Uncharacterized protein n=1 Tax=Oryza sativa subsp. japonica TaxID=39947 RepID=Q654U6_ORYSJ|nr:hypothetical protein [Oryza sativa Japonica Group]